VCSALTVRCKTCEVCPNLLLVSVPDAVVNALEGVFQPYSTMAEVPRARAVVGKLERTCWTVRTHVVLRPDQQACALTALLVGGRSGGDGGGRGDGRGGGDGGGRGCGNGGGGRVANGGGGGGSATAATVSAATTLAPRQSGTLPMLPPELWIYLLGFIPRLYFGACPHL
jgi:hypothetical protein